MRPKPLMPALIAILPRWKTREIEHSNVAAPHGNVTTIAETES